jgi:hypothetical protein
VHVIHQQVTFFNPALFLGGQAPEDLAQVLPQLRV